MQWWARYIGVPFRDGGRGPDAYDCWGLVRAAYADRLGVELPDHGEISARDLVRVARAMNGGQAAEPWVAVEVPEEMDVCLMVSGRGGAAVVHVGVMTGPAHLLHIEAASAAVVVPLRHHSVAGRIRGYRRFVAGVVA